MLSAAGREEEPLGAPISTAPLHPRGDSRLHRLVGMSRMSRVPGLHLSFPSVPMMGCHSPGVGVALEMRGSEGGGPRVHVTLDEEPLPGCAPTCMCLYSRG